MSNAKAIADRKNQLKELLEQKEIIEINLMKLKYDIREQKRGIAHMQSNQPVEVEEHIVQEIPVKKVRVATKNNHKKDVLGSLV